jgi:hypothetical protein
MWVRLLVLAVTVGLVSGCSADPGQPPASTTPLARSSTTFTATPSTSIPAPTSSSTSAAPTAAAEVRYFRFDDSGLFSFDGTSEARLVADGVVTASHDGMGGVLYTVTDQAWESGLHWTRPGAGVVETLNYLRGWGAVLDDRPMAVVERSTGWEACPETTAPVHLVDLLTGEERPLGCFGGEDGGVSVVSGGGELLVGTSWLAVGASGTDRRIHFYDTSGGEIEHPANPVPESCAPCELDVRLSPDGSLLAYRLRADAKWSQDLEELQRIDRLSYDEWWEGSRDIRGVVTVVDLGRGSDVFSTTVPAGERLVDFDGRRLVMESCQWTSRDEGASEHVCSSRLVDTKGEVAELAVPGRVRLASDACCSPPAVDVFPPLLRVWSPAEGEVTDRRVYRFEGIADPDAEVVAAGRYPVTVEAHGAWTVALVLSPGGNLATITATDAAGNTTTVKRSIAYRPALVLRDDGISVADFGEPADEVIARVADILGPPDLDEDEQVSDCYLSVYRVRFVMWEAAGLRLVFTDWGGTHREPVAAPLHLADWEVTGPGLRTESGLGWGSTVGELRAAHPDVMFGINEWAAMFFVPTPSDWFMGGFQWPMEEFLSALQRALNVHGAGLEITGEWDGPTTGAVLDFMEGRGLEPSAVLGALGLPPDDVLLGWMHGGRGPLCD